LNLTYEDFYGLKDSIGFASAGKAFIPLTNL